MDVQSNYSGKNRVSGRSGASTFLFARLGRGDAHPQILMCILSNLIGQYF